MGRGRRSGLAGEVGEMVLVVFGGVQEPTMMAQPSVSVCLALYVTLAAAKSQRYPSPRPASVDGPAGAFLG